MINMKLAGPALLALVAGNLIGCTYLSRPFAGAGDELTIRSGELGNDTSVAMTCDTAVYAAEDAQTVHVLLLDGTVDNPRRVMDIRMFWRPRAARTPLDPAATNTRVRLYVFEGDGVGVYGGGGHLWPSDDAGDEHWRALLRNATLRTMHATDGYADPFGVAIASGPIDARRDESRMLDLVAKMQQLAEDRLGVPLMLGAAE
jgi:hypothetical protein